MNADHSAKPVPALHPDASPSPKPASRASVRPPRSAVIRAPGLLPMLYTPSELADELGLTAPAIRDWLDRGLPHQRDERGRLWINGTDFAAWLERARRTGRSRALAEGEAYCVKCRRPVKPADPVCRVNGKAAVLFGYCPQCGTAVFRGARRG